MVVIFVLLIWSFLNSFESSGSSVFISGMSTPVLVCHSLYMIGNRVFLFYWSTFFFSFFVLHKLSLFLWLGWHSNASGLEKLLHVYTTKRDIRNPIFSWRINFNCYSSILMKCLASKNTFLGSTKLQIASFFNLEFWFIVVELVLLVDAWFRVLHLQGLTSKLNSCCSTSSL